MSRWTIEIPHRDRGESLVDVACSTRGLEDGEVMQSIVIDAATDGVRTAGELIDRLDAMSEPQRREILNRARQENGLKTVEQVEAREAGEQATSMARLRMARRPEVVCVVCGAPHRDSNGMPSANPPVVHRWHCPDHVHEAQPGDMDPIPPPVGLDMRLLDPDEIARERAHDERRKADERKRKADRLAEAQAIREARERYEEQVAEDDYARPLIAGIRGMRMDAR